MYADTRLVGLLSCSLLVHILVDSRPLQFRRARLWKDMCTNALRVIALCPHISWYIMRCSRTGMVTPKSATVPIHRRAWMYRKRNNLGDMLKCNLRQLYGAYTILHSGCVCYLSRLSCLETPSIFPNPHKRIFPEILLLSSNDVWLIRIRIVVRPFGVFASKAQT
jgi:hypothetical protein